MVVNLWKYRTLVVRNALGDLRHRYSGSVAGYLWNVFLPLAQIIVFALVFGALMAQRLPDSPMRDNRFGFVVFLCSGLLPWNAFAETLMRGVASLVAHAGYLKKLALPEQIFVAQDACTGFFTALVSLSIFLVFALAVGHRPSLAWLQALPLLVLFLGFAFGLGLLLSCVNVFYRDVQPLMNVVILLWFWLTPVVYTPDLFAKAGFAWVGQLLPFNPAYHFVLAFHDALYFNRLIPAQAWLLCAAIALAANAAGYAALRALRPEIRDAL